MNRRILSVLLFFCVFAIAGAQNVSVKIFPDRESWVYNLSEEVEFTIQVYKDGSLLKNVSVDYEIGPEFFPTDKKQNVILENGELKLKSSMDVPGFLRCRVWANVDGRQIWNLGTVGYDPDNIVNTAVEPEDFDSFWSNAISSARKIPLNPEIKLLEDRCTSDLNVYEVSFQNERTGSRMYGILSVPKKEGKYPAVLEVPGAGIRPYNNSDRGAETITLRIGIHGIPVTLEQEVYDGLKYGALRNYWYINKNRRDDHYYKRVYTGCIRAVDFIFTLPEFDGSTVGVTGGSQGGALSIVTAALDNRIKYLAAYYPALCDLNGYIHGRAGGWPHHFRTEDPLPGEVETLGYYDVVNFAKRLNVPGWYSWGYNDTTCPPTSMYAAYNSITTEKELNLYLEMGHRTVPEQVAVCDRWIAEKNKELKK
ncbi:MAG: acetylxylan esterase [Rikenellaceae bacterium]|nr:acetylxylan esterase [Rikenellaceae bacterium]